MSHGTRKGISWLTSLNAPAVISIKLESFLLQKINAVTRSVNLQVLICDEVYHVDHGLFNKDSQQKYYSFKSYFQVSSIVSCRGYLPNNNLHSKFNNY